MKAKSLDRRIKKQGIDDRLYFHRYRLSNSEYHEITQATSSTVLKDFYKGKNAAHCFKKYIAKSVPHKSSEAMLIGSATHKYILERRAFKNEFIVWEGGRKAGKDWNEFKEQNKGKDILSLAQMDQIRAMHKAVYACPEARQLLSGGQAEESVIWRDKDTGLLLRARADYVKMHKGVKILVDLKTCLSAEPETFTRDLIKLCYPIQEAHYREGFSRDKDGEEVQVTFAFIAVEKETNTVQVYTLDDGFDEAGYFLWRQTLNKWAEHIKNNEFPTYATGVSELKAPDWWVNKVLCYE